jgi:hypothetical protein
MSKFMVGDRVRPHNWPGNPPAKGGRVSSIRQGQDGGAAISWDNGAETIAAEQYLRYEVNSPQELGLRVECPACGQQPGRTCLSTVWSPGMDEVPVHEARMEAGIALVELVEATNKSLPKRPYTSIVVTWRDPNMRAARLFTLSGGGSWASADGVAFEGLDIIGFKVVGVALTDLQLDHVMVADALLRPVERAAGSEFNAGVMATLDYIMAHPEVLHARETPTQ